MTKSLKCMDNRLLAFHDFISVIVEAMDSRDPYTASHSNRVSDLTEYICTFFNVSASEREMIHIAAHLHDIGKIGVPDEILRKEGSLSELEWSTMKSHSDIGFKILSRIDGFQEIANIVLHHHERWDGGGYPDGLKGDSIPFGSKIIAIADSMDAMLSDRTYRRGISFQECRGEIEKNAGIMYDPKIVRKVMENWEKLREKMLIIKN